MNGFIVAEATPLERELCGKYAAILHFPVLEIMILPEP
jgi:hypothetical protein